MDMTSIHANIVLICRGLCRLKKVLWVSLGMVYRRAISLPKDNYSVCNPGRAWASMTIDHNIIYLTHLLLCQLIITCSQRF